jgi:hypothetical protein
MAYIIKNILGTLRGTVSQVVFKKKGELCYATSKPGKRPASKDPAAVSRMTQFKTAVEIASGVNRIDILKGLWPADPTKHLSRFQSIVGVNYKLVNGTDLSGDATLTPPFGFEVGNPLLSISADSILFTADALGDHREINDVLEKFLTGAGIVIMKDPTDNLSPKVNTMIIRAGMQSLATDAPISLAMTLTEKEKSILAKYTTKRAFFAMVTTDTPGNVIHYSTTYGS